MKTLNSNSEKPLLKTCIYFQSQFYPVIKQKAISLFSIWKLTMYYLRLNIYHLNDHLPYSTLLSKYEF